MHGKCFHSRPSSTNPRISPLTVEFVCPQVSLFITATASGTSRMEQQLDLIIPCWKIQGLCLRETLYVPQSKRLGHRTAQSSAATLLQNCAPAKLDAHPMGGPVCIGKNSTTSFLTTTTLIYTIEAGITAAAGTRLALQWILVKGFKLYSFQLPDLKRPGIVIFCHYLPVSGLGNLRACCLP